MGLAGDVADIGQHDHRHVLLDEAAHRFGRRRDLGEADIGERIERAGEVVGRGEQRLRGVGGRAGHDADGAAAPALVEQLHGAGRTLAGDLQPRDVVPDLDRQVDLGVGLAVVVLEGEARFAERQALEVERADDAVLGAAGGGAQNLDGQRARGVVGGGERMRGRQAAGDDRDRAALRRAGKPGDELRAAADVDAVGQPDHLHVGRSGEQPRDGRQRVAALDGVRHRLELLQPHARGGGRLQRNLAARLAERNDGDAAVVGLGAGDDVVGGAQPQIPARRGAKAVVDQQRDRRRAGRGRDRRIPQRSGGGEDDQRRQQEPQQRQPPRRAGRRVLLRLDVEQQPRRRKGDAPRPRRNKPQDPPQHGQAEQAEQHQRLREAEREAHHADLASAMPCGRRLVVAASLPSPMRACSAISSSLAVRSVRWMVKLQPSLLGLDADFVAVALQPRLVVGAPVLGAAGGDLAEAFRLGELDAAGIGEGLLGRIDDLNQMALRAIGGKLRQDGADFLDRAPQVGQHHDLRQRRRRKAGRQAQPLGRIVDHGLGHAVDHGAAAGRPHQAGQADALAGLDQDFGQAQTQR